MENYKLQFREVLIDILDRLSDIERKKLSFLLVDDIDRCICDDPTIGGALDLIQQLFDRNKISEENFTYLIQSFERIKCYQASNSLKELQRRKIEKVSRRNSSSFTNNSKSLSENILKDLEDEDKVNFNQNSNTLQILTNNNFNRNISNEDYLIKPFIEKTKENPSSLKLNRINNNYSSCHISFKASCFIRLCILTILFISFLLLILIGIKNYSLTSKSPPIITTTSVTTTSTNSNDTQCEEPRGLSCTRMTPENTKLEGLGVYYENPCYGTGCGFFHSNCRLCWIDPKAPGRMDRPQCPPCVSKVYHEKD